MVVLSWYPLGLADDHGEPFEDLVPWILDAALRHNLKVSISLSVNMYSCIVHALIACTLESTVYGKKLLKMLCIVCV